MGRATAACLAVSAASALAGTSEAGPDLLLSDGRSLHAARDLVGKGDPELTRALTLLRAEADAVLPRGPWSVVDKPSLPERADPHDYRSLAPYWWPDPAKPDGLPWIRRDGERNPASAGDAWDSRRFGQLRAAVGTLALAYYLTGHEPYARRAASLLRTWFLDPATRMRPHLRYAQAIPGINDGRSIGIIETARLPELLDRVELLAGSPAWTSDDARGLRDWMASYLRWLLDSEPGRLEGRHPNNHGSWYDVQVAGLALRTGQPGIARDQLSGPTRDRIGAHIEPDGRQPRELARTRSLSYSVFNLEALASAATLADHVGVDLWSNRTPDGRSIERALDYLLPFADAARAWPHSQITEPPWNAFDKLLRLFDGHFDAARLETAHRQLSRRAPLGPENVFLCPVFETGISSRRAP